MVGDDCGSHKFKLISLVFQRDHSGLMRRVDEVTVDQMRRVDRIIVDQKALDHTGKPIVTFVAVASYNM